MREITFTIAGLPVAFARSGGRGTIRFTPKKQRLAGNHAADVAAEAMAEHPLLEGPIKVAILAVWPWPASASAKKRAALGAQYRTSRPDADNVAKLICDALNGVCWGDDAQVVVLQVEKQYGTTAFTRITIETLGGDA